MSNPVTLAEAADVFLNRYQKTTTKIAYRQDLRHLMTFVAPSLPLSQITGFDMERALGGLAQMETIRSVHTLNKFIKAMRTFFNWCQKRGLINNAAQLRLDYLPVPEHGVLERTMSNDDYLALVSFYSRLAALKPHIYQRALALVLLVGDSGARRGELGAMRWSDFDFEDLRVVTRGKGDKLYRRVFGRATAAVLQQWRLIQKVALDIAPEHAYVFSHSGKPISGPAVAQYFRRRCVEAGINGKDKNGYGVHAVRHNLGFRLQDAKVPDNLAAAVMGHSVDTYRKHYATTDDARVKEAALEVAFRFKDLPIVPSEKIRDLKTSGDTS